MVVHLRFSDAFLNNSAVHEDSGLRHRIAYAVPAIIEELGLIAHTIDAAAPDSLDRVLAAVSAALR